MGITDISLTMPFGTQINNARNFSGSKKNFTDLKKNISCYFEQNLQDIVSQMAMKFDNSTEIKIIETRFFKGFINSMSNIFKNNSSRVTNLTEEQQENFRNESIWIERYLNISKEAMLYIKSETDYQALDPSEYLLFSKDIIFVQSSSDVLKFEVGQQVMISKQDMRIEDIQKEFKDDDFIVYVDEDFENSVIETLPFVIVRPKRIEIPYLNPLTTIEMEFICAISWGMYNANPKMLSQVTAYSDEDRDKVKEALKPFGKTFKIMTLGTNDKIGVVDLGDLKNLLDLFSAWKMIIEQRALMNGVDKNAVYIQQEMISGEAKKVEMLYINEVRKDNFPIFKKYEKDFAKKMTEMFGKQITIENIIYEDIALSSEDMSKNITEQKADSNINENKEVIPKNQENQENLLK